MFYADKARCLAAGYLLGRCLGLDEERFVKNQFGKPYAPGSGIYFNLSHGGDYVVLAVSEREIGVDIEPIGDGNNADMFRAFTNDERVWMKSQSGNDVFCRLWTAKESIMKATGKGLSLPPESFNAVPCGNSAIEADGRRWILESVFFDNHIICTAVERQANE
jgi:4'-phosphopantetheinyl transferase